MSNYVDNSGSARLLDTTIKVYSTSVLKKIFSWIGDIFKKYFTQSVTSKLFTVFDFENTQYKKSLLIKIFRSILSPFVFVTNKIVWAMEISAKDSVFVKMISSCIGMSVKIFNGSVAGKMINHYLEGEN